MMLLGLLLAVAALLGGHFLEGGALGQLLNLPAAIIVFGGTLGAAFIQTGSRDTKQAFKLMKGAMAERHPNGRGALDQLMNWSHRVRSHGLLELEKDLDAAPNQLDIEMDGFVRTGLELLIDGKDGTEIRSVLHNELVTSEQVDLRAVKMVESMGGYAPTMGILGAVLGLIQVMSNLADPQMLGQGIAIAFVATVYGVAAANLLLIPLSNRIKNGILARYQYHEMILEGFIAISQGQSPRIIEQRLTGYLK